MNYKEKYNEALERARALRQEAIDKGYAIDYVKDYEAIFPELAESEDERIRKELIEAFEVYDIESSWNLIPVKHILAWLEKQKEPEHICDSAQYEEGFKTGLEIGLRKQKGQKPAEWSEEDEASYNAFICEVVNEKMNPTIEQVKWLRGICDRLKSLHPQPHWKPSEEQDYSGLSDLERAIHRGFLCAGVENVPVAIIKETAKEVQSILKVEG